jgi:hypothetical protein
MKALKPNSLSHSNDHRKTPKAQFTTSAWKIGWLLREILNTVKEKRLLRGFKHFQLIKVTVDLNISTYLSNRPLPFKQLDPILST